MINKIEFMKDMLGRKLSLRAIEQKYNLKDCVETYLTVKQEYPQEFIDQLVREVYYND